MIIKLILLSVVLLSFAFLGIGIKLLFDRHAKIQAGSCHITNDADGSTRCGCGAGQCMDDQERI